MNFLASIKERPIPFLDSKRSKKTGYRSWKIDIDSPYLNEECVEATSCGISGKNYYHYPDNPPYFQSIPGSIPELFLRKSVVEKLLQINSKLKPIGLELFLFDAYRPIEVQNYMHDTWFPNHLKMTHPEWDEKRVWEEVAKFWAKGTSDKQAIDPFSPPPHSTGGAVDLTLRRIDGTNLWMGTEFDDAREYSYSDHFEKETMSPQDLEARHNRRMLYWLMIEEGFANNPTEWWHYSFGDQMWAKLSSTDDTTITAHYSIATAQ